MADNDTARAAYQFQQAQELAAEAALLVQARGHDIILLHGSKSKGPKGDYAGPSYTTTAETLAFLEGYVRGQVNG